MKSGSNVKGNYTISAAAVLSHKPFRGCLGGRASIAARHVQHRSELKAPSLSARDHRACCLTIPELCPPRKRSHRTASATEATRQAA